MEPCLFRHGKGATEWTGTNEDILLQWSHVFSDMVSFLNTLFPLIRRIASMEPCLFRHGKTYLQNTDRYDIGKLQWSHVFSDMVRRIISRIIMSG
ncbi:protein of unknown function [Methanoculleus bourgensis]|uniref:Uncharacterized protein n=1 Tax=Methanoculleus bourgensis TaxID=83986 RepID=A0A0X8XYP3_9EURY|nr:protein of unknown function [Methanoculleus bourgensis]